MVTMVVTGLVDGYHGGHRVGCHGDGGGYHGGNNDGEHVDRGGHFKDLFFFCDV